MTRTSLGSSHTSFKAFALGLGAALALTLGLSGQPDTGQDLAAQPAIVKLERVVVVGQRHIDGKPVQRLPRVEISGLSLASSQRLALAAKAAACSDTQPC